MFFNYKEVYYLYFNKILCIYIYIYANKSNKYNIYNVYKIIVYV